MCLTVGSQISTAEQIEAHYLAKIISLKKEQRKRALRTLKFGYPKVIERPPSSSMSLQKQNRKFRTKPCARFSYSY